MANVNGRPTLGNAWLSNGAIARDIDDFEQVMDANDFDALTRMLDEKKAIEDYENEDYKELYEPQRTLKHLTQFLLCKRLRRILYFLKSSPA